MNELDRFFSNLTPELDKLTIKPPLSNCCGATSFGELFRDFGRCSDCLEMAEFKKEAET